MKKRSLLACLGLLVTMACASENRSHVREAMNLKDKEALERVGRLTHKLSELPSSGRLSRRPWNGFYWPNYRGGLGLRLFSLPYSPAEKLLQVAPASSLLGGAILTPKTDASRWWGICNGVAEASTLIDIPNEIVTYKGVDFYPHDLKALAGQLLASGRGDYLHVGLRNNLQQVALDAQGRPFDRAARDVNPGAFHILAANSIALRDKPFFIDLQSDNVVLIYAAFQFAATNKGVITDAAQLALLRQRSPNATLFIEMETILSLADSHTVTVEDNRSSLKTVTTTLRYILELNEEGLIVGGEWLNNEHPDFAYLHSPSFDWQSMQGSGDFKAILSSPQRRAFDPDKFLKHQDAQVDL